ncbi:MAG TPA: MBOAT family O-acyltransferase [Pirellulales bacterium]|jgi:alginate O-acetyltransferase complex protein AlgI|nr:MBOAT family O-acyltransferase [Pirellulales bacterium]
MVFSSPVFLFLFLPLTLGLCFACPPRWRNLPLLAASLLFYAWGEPQLLTVMLASIALNYGFGLWVESSRTLRSGPWVLALAVAINLAALIYFKYTPFLVDTLNGFTSLAGLAQLRRPQLTMPIGISFYTFHAISYVNDVHRGKTTAQRNLASMALYITLFPQLIAGPIIRYADVASQLAQRITTSAGFAEGIRRFVLGLGKKMLIANAAATVADAVFDISDGQLVASVAWLGLVCYTLQIYFDFSGYSDMAIGLGLMLGFRFLENFNYPYVARSITEFWRRWHISLSTWYRDYLYIPLGGNRCARWRVGLNLLTVFLLCGLWHGASWSFAAWGLFHGLFLVLERWGLSRHLERGSAPLRHAYTLAVVMAGWVLFRADSLAHAWAYLRALAGAGAAASAEHPLGMYLDTGLVLVLAAGCLGATPLAPWLAGRCEGLVAGWRDRPRRAAAVEALFAAGRISTLAAVLAASTCVMLAATYNPFIYFRF